MKTNCFNPCFNGFTSLTKESQYYKTIPEEVSILVLMDSLL